MAAEAEVVVVVGAEVGRTPAVPVMRLAAASVSDEGPRRQLLKPSQLPIYSAPPLGSRYVEEQPGRLQLAIASVRTTVGRYVGWCQGVYIFVKTGIADTVRLGKDAYVYLKNPPQDFLPRAGVIAASGLAGLASARRGPRWKKMAYPLGLAAAGASVCYPAQAVIVAKVAGKKAYAAGRSVGEAVGSAWTGSGARDSAQVVAHTGSREAAAETPPPPPPVPLRDSMPAATGAETQARPSPGVGRASLFKADPELLDHGQANPEDRDMYSTRS
ncbi:MICOS complex subunit MIC27 isoform X2 [Tachyglossus aculeatus]|uniref:MICOS complex subunit MIC27 isoform X2 n=1 Tax=Tachyglossus aculeatus TaxID=9261 RepID=UPI0018F2C57E|nr:MICOS complex subunit MIC27 isoform X2 [Tachyglossus aculeatus]